MVEERVALCGLVKVSDEDLEWLYPGRDPLEAAAAWAKAGPKLVVLTRGGKGATAFTGKAHVTLPAPAIKLVDTVGAGDSFMSALLTIMHEEGALGAGLRAPDEAAMARWAAFAVKAAAITCGARLSARFALRTNGQHPVAVAQQKQREDASQDGNGGPERHAGGWSIGWDHFAPADQGRGGVHQEYRAIGPELQGAGCKGQQDQHLCDADPHQDLRRGILPGIERRQNGLRVLDIDNLVHGPNSHEDRRRDAHQKKREFEIAVAFHWSPGI